MLKYAAFFGAVLLLAAAAYANPHQGSTPPGGWGTDCSEWVVMSDPWCSPEMIYMWPSPGGAAGFHDCAGNDIVWPGLDIELWIEMECVICWDATHAQIHRASDYSDLEIFFCGSSRCNNGQWLIATPPPGGSLAYLPFVQDMFGRTTGGTNIPLTWEYSVDGSAYLPMEDGEDGAKQFVVGLCDHTFCVKVTGDIVYHQPDGYYNLTGGSICPAEPL